MKKVLKHSINKSISELLGHVETQQYTKQTLESLFRSLLETIIDSREEAIVLLNIREQDGFEGLLNRLKYANADVYSYSGNVGFKHIELNEAVTDDFLIIISDWFSVILFWNKQDVIYNGFCALHPVYVKDIVDHLQAISFDESLNSKLHQVKRDRRHNVKFNSILTKLLTSLELSQRDLLCVDNEVGLSNVNASISLSDFERFCSTMFHELRNPLGVVDLYAEIAKRSYSKADLDEELVAKLDKSMNFIKQAVENMDRILVDLKESYKPLELNKESNDLVTLISDVVEFVSVSYQEKQVSLSFINNSIDSIEYNMDKGKLYQVFLNLLKNALEATEAGNWVEVNLQENETSYDIRFIDNGIGVPDETVQQLFLPYFTTKEDGSGIGLYLSRKFIEAHNGTLEIEKSDKTVFKVSLDK